MRTKFNNITTMLLAFTTPTVLFIWLIYAIPTIKSFGMDDHREEAKKSVLKLKPYKISIILFWWITYYLLFWL